MYKVRSILFIISILSYAFVYEQNTKKDSLLHLSNITKNDSIRCQSYLDIGDLYETSNFDSAYKYYNKCRICSEKKSLKSMTGLSYRYIAALYIEKNDNEKTIYFYNKAIDIYKSINDLASLAKCYNNSGIVYYRMGVYDKAIDLYLKSLKIRESTGDKEGQALCYLNIGSIYKDQKTYDKALDYYKRSLETSIELNNKKGIYLGYNNIGIVNYLMGNRDSSIVFYKEALKIAEELNDKKGMMMCLNNFGITYKSQNNYKQAINYYEKSLVLSEEISNDNSTAIILENIASMHSSLADTAQQNSRERAEHLKAAITYANRAIEIARKIESKPIENNAAKILMNIYKKLKNPDRALEFAELYIITKDSMFNDDKTKSLAEAEKKFESEKKQLMIDKLNKEKELQASENKKQKILIYSFILGFIIILAFSFIVVRLFLLKKKANLILAHQKQQIEIQNANLHQAKEEITAQRDEIAAQRDLVTEQKEHIEEQKKEIDDSIQYAKRIQQAVLPDLSAIARKPQADEPILSSEGKIASHPLAMTLDYFILFRPKDVVSGDFYWATNVNEWFIACVADCTGHGVPGAFMSMLGISFLNEIVRKKEVTKASDVLNSLRESVIDALKQTGLEGTQKDGMDMSLIAIKTTLQAQTSEGSKPSEVLWAYAAQWAGANNPLYVIARNEITKQSISGITSPSVRNDEIEFYELKGDKMPIAIYERMDEFTNHDLVLNSGDTIYLMSDGYEDQFGGPKRKKFLSKNLKQLLIENCRLKMSEQRIMLDKKLVNWIGDGEQIDDITILGIEIK